jgi:hypothetical protein
MSTQAETIAAEKMRRKRFVALLGKCEDCGQPVMEGQEFLRSDNGIRHTLCFYDPAYAKRVCELKRSTEL